MRIIAGILLCYVGYVILDTGWSHFYKQPVPKPVGWVIIIFGVGLVSYDVFQFIKKKLHMG